MNISKNILLHVVAVMITLTGCSSNPVVITEKDFEETNKPFLTTYQTQKADVVMATVDHENDQVEIIAEDEYVYWSNNTQPYLVVKHEPNEVQEKPNPFNVGETLMKDHVSASMCLTEACTKCSDKEETTCVDPIKKPFETFYNVQKECKDKECKE